MDPTDLDIVERPLPEQLHVGLGESLGRHFLARGGSLLELLLLLCEEKRGTQGSAFKGLCVITPFCWVGAKERGGGEDVERGREL
jgi:hypothetical protein